MNLREQFIPFDVVGPELIKFWREWPGPGPKLKANDLPKLVRVAIEPRDVLPPGMAIGPAWFAERFILAPDFLLKAIAKIRRIWFKDSKRQQLKNFMAVTPAYPLLVNPHSNWGEEGVQALLDKEIADAFNVQRKCDEAATVGDVKQARVELRAGYEIRQKRNL